MTKTSVARQAHSEIAGVIEIRHQRPMVSSLKIAELFERQHKSVIRVLRELSQSDAPEEIGTKSPVSKRGKGEKTKQAAGILSGSITWDTYADAYGREQPIAWLSEREALIAMPFIGGRHAHEGQRKLVDAYLYYRDAFANPPRADLIRSKRDASHILTDSILEWRTDQGKDTTRHHYSSEHELCNWAVRGTFKGIDEASLTNEEMELLRLVRERNAAMIVSGIPYQERKTRLNQYAIRQRTRLLPSLQVAA